MNQYQADSVCPGALSTKSHGILSVNSLTTVKDASSAAVGACMRPWRVIHIVVLSLLGH